MTKNMNIHDKRKCPICGNDSGVFYRKVYDDRYGYPGEFDLYRCEVCKHVFLNIKFDDDVISDLYTNYYPRSSFNIENFKPSQPIEGIAAWLRGKHFASYVYVPKNVKVLDIGCGFGNTVAYHKNRGCDAYGSEVDQNVALIAEKYDLNIYIGQYNSDNYKPDFFDYITMDQLIEHVEDPVELLTGAYKNLKKGGKLIISTPNVNGWGVKWYKEKWLHWHAPYHLHFFSPKSIETVAERCGFKVSSIKNATFSDWLYWQWIHLQFLPQNGHPNIYWKPRNDVKFSEAQIQKLEYFSKLRKLRINDVITRLFDISRMGDNYIFELTKP